MKASRIVMAGAAALAACGVLGMVSPAVQASSALAATWTRQAPATSPSVRYVAAMAYDAATGTVVLFGGLTLGGLALGDTWTWNGTTWTQQAPATSPPARFGAAMAYDAATGTAVLFGGQNGGHYLDDTWTWNGTTWTQQAPAVHPPVRYGAAMAYDAATGTAVLFGGEGSVGHIGRAASDTWTWDGTTWTRQAPAAHPTARYFAAMAYDVATGTVVLFSGLNNAAPPRPVSGTWIWNGTTWTKHAPVTSPPARGGGGIAYDAATGTVVLFGGYNSAEHSVGDTWTWDGTTWARQTPATSPPARRYASMAYDAAAGNVVLFGGAGNRVPNDTWTWG